MLSKLSFLAAFAVIMSAYAECPNSCSGHGRCTNYEPRYSTGMAQKTKLLTTAGSISTYGYDTSREKKDSCTCFHKIGHDGSKVYGWTGPDCSLKTCPYGKAHGGLPGQNNDHTSMEECSGAGKCDRKKGVCQCVPGFTGHNCGRTECPNDCSGNGICKTLKQIAHDVHDLNGNFEFSTNGIKYDSAFDAEQSRACVCDPRWVGADCSIRQCKSGADPMGGKGSEYGRECSGRGKCQAGSCLCHTGFFGTECENQRANAEE